MMQQKPRQSRGFYCVILALTSRAFELTSTRSGVLVTLRMDTETVVSPFLLNGTNLDKPVPLDL